MDLLARQEEELKQSAPQNVFQSDVLCFQLFITTSRE